MNFNKLWFLWQPNYYRLDTLNYLKMLVLVTTISVPKFMFVSQSAQFT